MNGENAHPSGYSVQSKPSRAAWRDIWMGQLRMLAAFVGMSLVVIALASSVHGGAGHARAIAALGALLVAMAWRRVARIGHRVEAGGKGR